MSKTTPSLNHAASPRAVAEPLPSRQGHQHNPTILKEEATMKNVHTQSNNLNQQQQFKSLPPAQYERWAKQTHVSIAVVSVYHQLTGIRPAPGVRKVNAVIHSPGLLQLSAASELLGACMEASLECCRARQAMEQAKRHFEEARALEQSLEQARKQAHSAFRRLSGTEERVICRPVSLDF
jgi:hypothetical protein